MCDYSAQGNLHTGFQRIHPDIDILALLTAKLHLYCEFALIFFLKRMPNPFGYNNQSTSKSGSQVAVHFFLKSFILVSREN